MVDILTSLPPFHIRDEDQVAVTVDPDPDRIYSLIGSWWSSITKNNTGRLPRPVVPIRLNFLHQNYLERAAAGEDSEALLRHVIRIAEIMTYVHNMIHIR